MERGEGANLRALMEALRPKVFTNLPKTWTSMTTIYDLLKGMQSAGWAVFFAGLGLPGLCGFIGEVLVTLSSWNYSRVLAVCSAFTVILTAAYMTRCVYLTFFGEYRGHHHPHESPKAITVPLIVLSVFSVFAGLLNAAPLGVEIRTNKPLIELFERRLPRISGPTRPYSGVKAPDNWNSVVLNCVSRKLSGSAENAESALSETRLNVKVGRDSIIWTGCTTAPSILTRPGPVRSFSVIVLIIAVNVSFTGVGMPNSRPILAINPFR